MVIRIYVGPQQNLLMFNLCETVKSKTRWDLLEVTE